MVLLGGLGGGGDIGLALVLEPLLEGAGRVVYVSFAECSPGSYGGRRVAGALYVPTAYHPRDFEWALARVRPGARVYRLCVEGPRGEVWEAVEWLEARYSPECTLHADIGGDGLLTGYEGSLGSYVADTLARAVLAEAAERLGWRSVIAVGGLQLEGGRRRLFPLEEQVADLLYYEEAGALLGVVDPPAERVGEARRLLHPGREMVSVMLPVYLAALEGRRGAYVARGYSTGFHEVDWWTRYVFLVDNLAACRASPLCEAAREGWIDAIKGWEPPPPRGAYSRALKRARADPERVLRRLIRRHLKPDAVREACGLRR